MVSTELCSSSGFEPLTMFKKVLGVGFRVLGLGCRDSALGLTMQALNPALSLEARCGGYRRRKVLRVAPAS